MRKRISSGGEVSTNDLLQIIKKTFPNSKINNIYASTEFGTILSPLMNTLLSKIPKKIIYGLKRIKLKYLLQIAQKTSKNLNISG